MGMFDNITVEYPLPDTPVRIQKELFQTKDFGDGFVGGFLDDYTITAEGKLIRHNKTYEHVEEEDRPYYGKPEWNKNPLFQIMGSMKTVSLDDEEIDFNGNLTFYSFCIDDDVWYEYNAKFTDGKLESIERIFREYGI